MKRFAFYGVVLLQVLFLTGMSISYYAMDAFGQTIKLETAPVDPRDIFYGDYVILNYEIERIDEEKWSGGIPEYGEAVYILLEESDNGVFQVVTASRDKMETEADQVRMRGKYQWHNEGQSVHQVTYGINRYYVEENTGGKYEQQRDDMVVEVVVAPWGQKKIVSIK
ncbi:GDYXXLXY domain-containing protein [Thalassobacillus devorans]|uniref:GDYXXLXY domain-containing protein n=1 Tax=Thalassobacillus devorans TaxID=279813 RepID=UPI00048AE6F7|nr:GDYXXLXY domain-containing protein [Thalassobacillus devorans]